MTVTFTLFFYYSFVGFLIELAYARLTHGPKQDRKCLLFLPLCPVYGLGTCLILAMPPFLLHRPVAVFVGGALLATLAEYAVALFYDVAVGVRFWDYSDRPGNLSGRVCPLYTLFWGVLALALVYVLQPLSAPLLAHVPGWLTGLGFLLFAADGLVSLWLLHRARDTAVLMWYRAG